MKNTSLSHLRALAGSLAMALRAQKQLSGHFVDRSTKAQIKKALDALSDANKSTQETPKPKSGSENRFELNEPEIKVQENTNLKPSFIPESNVSASENKPKKTELQELDSLEETKTEETKLELDSLEETKTEEIKASLTPWHVSSPKAEVTVPKNKTVSVSELLNSRTSTIFDKIKATKTLKSCYSALNGCGDCGLSNGRTKLVFGSGDNNARLLIVGGPPSEEEDQKGLPFVGKSGTLLNKILSGIKISHNDVYFTNVVKCHPPTGRAPKQGEIEKCLPILQHQIALIKPEVIVLMGEIAAKALFSASINFSDACGRWRSFKNIQVMTTYHPSFLLEEEPEEIITKRKRKMWFDMKKIMEQLS